MTHGARIPEMRGRANVRWIRMATDLPAAIQSLAQRRLSLSDYVRTLGGPIEFAMVAPDDLVPAILDFPLLVTRALRRGVA
jgi:hypothetical protein